MDRCHYHCHLDLHYEYLLNDEIKKNSNLIKESIVLDALRVPGNKVMLTEKLGEKNELILRRETWGLRWNSICHQRVDEQESEVRWIL